MKPIIILALFFFACDRPTNKSRSTLETLQKTIDRTLQKREDHIDIYLGVKTSGLKQLIDASKDVKDIISDSTLIGREDIAIKSLFRTKHKNLIFYNDWTNNIDTTLTGIDLKINILANELSFINNNIEMIERRNEYSFKEIRVLTKDIKNTTQVYITPNIRQPFSKILFAYTINDSLQFSNGILDTMRIVARHNGDHFTIVNKDGINYRYVLKFAKADGTFEYLTVR